MPITPLSQAHLTLLDTCDRKYQYVFYDALAAPSTYDQQLTTQWGSQFHLLMQQRAMNLPVSAIAPANEEMAASMSALTAAAPNIFKTNPDSQSVKDDSFRQSEHRRTLAFNDYLLTAIYDLLILEPKQGQIFDWKTHQKPPKKAWLQQDWQTRLYLYILCETTDLSPEQLSMTYWFVRLGNRDRTASKSSNSPSLPSAYQFAYSLEQHQQTQRDLQALTSKLTRMREQMQFPKVSEASELCDTCTFNVRCDRAPSTLSLYESARLLRQASEISLESVEEIPL